MTPGTDTTARVVVVGGGVIGLSCAYDLARAGVSVVLLEREALAAGASLGNAGTVSAGHPPLNRPGRVRQAITQMLDSTSPLYIPPRWDPELWRWMVEFARNCTEQRVAECMDVMAPLGHEAIRLFDALIEEEAIHCGYRADGYYDVCATQAGLSRARGEAALIERHGYRPEPLDGDELRRVDPALGRSVLGGVHYPEARTLDPGRFMSELAARARAHGVEISEGVDVASVVVASGRVEGVRTGTGESIGADWVVVATGPYSLRLSRRLGVWLPVQPGKGYHRDLPVEAGGSPPLRIACVLNEASVFCTPMDRFVRFAGTMEFSGPNRSMRPERLEQLTTAARGYFPALGRREPISEWCGLRPMSADGLPIVGTLPGVEGVSVATGHGMLGLTLAPVTGRLIRDEVMGRPDPRFVALSPARFA
jgi:D-amino-acid dehydrogenase